MVVQQANVKNGKELIMFRVRSSFRLRAHLCNSAATKYETFAGRT